MIGIGQEVKMRGEYHYSILALHRLLKVRPEVDGNMLSLKPKDALRKLQIDAFSVGFNSAQRLKNQKYSSPPR